MRPQSGNPKNLFGQRIPTHDCRKSPSPARESDLSPQAGRGGGGAEASPRYFNSMITALAEPRTTSSVWMRSRLLKRISPDLYSLTTDLPFGSVDCSGESSR